MPLGCRRYWGVLEISVRKRRTTAVLVSSVLLAAACGDAPDTSAGPDDAAVVSPSTAPSTADVAATEPTAPPESSEPAEPDTVGHATSPTGDRLSIDDLAYLGAFRLTSETLGESSTNYAAGPIGYHAANRSLFVAGHTTDNAIAEFAIPATLGTGNVVGDLPVVETALQPFTTPLDAAPTGNPDGLDRIDGLFVHDGRLIVNAEEWYDADTSAADTTLTLDADDIAGSVSGFFELDGRVQAGGYLSPVPAEWQTALGGSTITGWAANTSIIGRHSVGPSLFVFEPDDLIGRDATIDPAIATIEHMNFPHSGGNFLDPDALVTREGGASPLWNFLSKAVYAFIAPGTDTFVVVGNTGGVDSGIGYKITQDDGNVCGGYCPYRHDDVSNAYWLFDVNDILAAGRPHEPRPYAYGAWSVPFDDDGDHAIIGGAFDPDSSTLYLTLSHAGQVGTYDRPPLVVAYSVPAIGTFSPAAIDGPATVGETADRVVEP